MISRESRNIFSQHGDDLSVKIIQERVYREMSPPQADGSDGTLHGKSVNMMSMRGNRTKPCGSPRRGRSERLR